MACVRLECKIPASKVEEITEKNKEWRAEVKSKNQK